MSKQHSAATPPSLNNIKLLGHSGCKLEIEKRGDTYVVTKTAKDAAYNTRLIAQHEKQKAFTHDRFRTPAIVDSGHKNGLFTFSMEYVHGFTLAEHLKSADVYSIQSIADTFLSTVPNTYSFDTTAKTIFAEKVTSVSRTVGSQTDPSLRSAFRRLEIYNWDHIMQSDCHGDLSLENIIWCDGDLYLIDFLDSFYNSWMIDFGKLLFDIECLWSYRHNAPINENLKTRLSVFKKMILDGLRNREQNQKIVADVYHIALLHILRILPYTNDDQTKKYLYSSVNKLQDVIESL